MLQRPISVAVLLLAIGAQAPAQTLFRSVNGPSAGQQFGRTCLLVPDQNGDGFQDLLVGAPSFNGGRGAVHCVSGAFLATGTGAAITWTVAPTNSPGDQFGYSLAVIGDVNGDGHDDFVVGEPGDDTGGTDAGAVRLLTGIAHVAGSPHHYTTSGARFGTAVTGMSELTGNGRPDFGVSAPGAALSLFIAVDSVTLLGSGPINSSNWIFGLAAATSLGTSMARGYDYDGDGFDEIVLGNPAVSVGGVPDCGSILLLSATPTGINVRTYNSSLPGERLGQSVSLGDDFDGDGAPDILVGAPNSADIYGHQVGRVLVLSGKRLYDHTPPYEIFSLPFGNVLPPVNHADPTPNFHLGAAVKGCGDLNGDGVGEILAGAPDYFTPGTLSGFNFRGTVRVYSGASGAHIASINGASTDRLGDGLAGTVFDFDGDGRLEFAVAGSLSDAGGTDSGVLRTYRLFPLLPSTYCAGKLNSLGCTPLIGYAGLPSRNSGAPFLISASNVLNQKSGLLFYAHTPTSVPFQGGIKCVATPNQRTPAQSSGGSTSGNDCSGTFSLDFNAWITSGADPSLTLGAEVFAQYWSRDPASPSHTSLSNALRFVINP